MRPEVDIRESLEEPERSRSSGERLHARAVPGLPGRDHEARSSEFTVAVGIDCLKRRPLCRTLLLMFSHGAFLPH
jgi:hypothetical protein